MMLSSRSHRLYNKDVFRRMTSMVWELRLPSKHISQHSIRTFTSSSAPSNSDEDKEWIPPSRPLSGDKGNYENMIGQSRKEKPTKIPLVRKQKKIEKDEEAEKNITSENKKVNVQFVDAAAILGNDEDDDDEFYDDDEEDDDEDILKEENWVDPFQNGNLSKHRGELVNVDIENFIENMKEQGLDFNEGIFDDDEDDEILDNMSQEELMAMAKREGSWIDLDSLKEEEIQRIFEDMERSGTPKRVLPASPQKKSNDEDIPDWSSARRKRLGTPTAMLTPQDARAARQLDGEIPVKFHTLFTSDEITDCLKSLGGMNVVVIPLPLDAHMGNAMIVATGTTGTHLRTMADALVKSLRTRKLHKMGVVGADSGAEGYDCDDWIVVDCRNYTVHLQDELTRKHIGLEQHWSPEEVSKRRRNPINFNNDDAVDDFVRDNPIPDEYFRSLSTNAMEDNAGFIGFDPKKLRKTTVLPLAPSRRRPKGGKVKGSKGAKRR